MTAPPVARPEGLVLLPSGTSPGGRPTLLAFMPPKDGGCSPRP